MTKDFSIKPYVKTQVGAFVVPSKTSSVKDPLTVLPYANEAVGVKEEIGNFFTKAEIGVGTSATVKAAMGYEVPIGEHFGLELSADACAAQSLIGKDVEITNDVVAPNTVVINDTFYNLENMHALVEHNECSVVKYKESYMGAGVNLMAKWHPVKEFTLGVGVRASRVSANTAGVSFNQEIEGYDDNAHLVDTQGHHTDIQHSGVDSIKTNYKIGENYKQTVVSPVFEIKAGTNVDGLNFGAVLGFDSVQAGVTYNF
jgi:hypothetical protein